MPVILKSHKTSKKFSHSITICRFCESEISRNIISSDQLNIKLSICKTCSDKMETVSALPISSFEAVEIFAVGTWNDHKFTLDDLKKCVESFNRFAKDNSNWKPFIKIDHQPSPVFEDHFRLGTIDKLWIEGDKLMATFINVPAAFAQLIKAGACNLRSIEIWETFDYNGNVYPMFLEACAFFGSGHPAVSTISDFIQIYYGVKAAETLVNPFDRRQEKVRIYSMGKDSKKFTFSKSFPMALPFGNKKTYGLLDRRDAGSKKIFNGSLKMDYAKIIADLTALLAVQTDEGVKATIQSAIDAMNQMMGDMSQKPDPKNPATDATIPPAVQNRLTVITTENMRLAAENIKLKSDREAEANKKNAEEYKEFIDDLQGRISSKKFIELTTRKENQLNEKTFRNFKDILDFAEKNDRTEPVIKMGKGKYQNMTEDEAIRARALELQKEEPKKFADIVFAIKIAKQEFAKQEA